MTDHALQRILVIDDNPAIHDDFRKILAGGGVTAPVEEAETRLFGLAGRAREIPSFEVDCAFQGAEGLARAATARAAGRPYALAFVDVRMPPGWDGIDTIKQLWAEDAALQVVICTAFSDYSARELIRQLGRTDRLLILKKPFDNIEVRLLASSLTEKWRLGRRVQAHVAELEALVKERTLELEQSLSLIQATLDATADGILVVDRAGRVVNYNAGLLRLWEIPVPPTDACVDDRLLTPILDQLPNPEEFLRQIRQSADRVQTEQLGVVEFKDGRLFEYRLRPQRAAGEPAGCVWSFRDVTRRRRAEEALRASEYQYRLLFECNPSPVFVCDADSLAFLAVNDAAIRHYGHTREEFPGLTLRDVFLPEEMALFQAKLGKLTPESAACGIWRHRKKGGQLSEMEITAHALAFPGRNAWLTVAMDVTERLSLEAQLRQSQKMESVGQLAGGIAHDFNNLLTVIHGHTGILLARPGLAAEQAEPLKEIAEAARRAADLTRQLLTFSRKQSLHLQVVDLNEVVSNIGKMLRRILGEDVALHVNFSPSLPATKADLGMIEQILLNLAVNSRDAMPRGGRLEIATSTVLVDADQARSNPEATTGRFVRLTFSDSGSGIAPEHLPRIFEPFFTTKELDRGTGLGLATVYGIVKQHQGWITVASRVNEGTTFEIFLPACAEKSGDAALPPVEQRVIGGTETVLVVEDEPPLLKLIHHVLESHGYKVLDAATGSAALEHWEEHRKKIELVLTDLVLPDGMSGPELVQILQATKPALKVIYTSGYSMEKLAKDFHFSPGANFIQKPFHARKLAETVYDCLNTR